jgi:RNase P/RNase MRP subunit POP5
MAQRALERFDREVHGGTVVALDRERVDEILVALELLEERDTSLDPALAALRADLQQDSPQEGA